MTGRDPLSTGCSSPERQANPYGASTAKIGESVALLGWNISISNLRWEECRVLVDVDPAPSEQVKQHARPEDIRFGLYGALAHPIEADGPGSCNDVASLAISPPSAPIPDRLTGTVCLGPLDNQSEVRGIYVYSPRDRIAGTTAAYPAALPIGVLPTNRNGTGVTVKSTSVEAWRADGTMLSQASLGDSAIFTGNGYMLLALRFRRSRNSTATNPPSAEDRWWCCWWWWWRRCRRGMGSATPARRTGRRYWCCPTRSSTRCKVDALLCSQGEINQAVLYATLSVLGTHAPVWIGRD